MAAAFSTPKATADPHRFIRANTTSVLSVKSPPSDASKTSDCSQGQARRDSRKDVDSWEDDSALEWRHSFCKWVDKRKTANANSIAKLHCEPFCDCEPLSHMSSSSSRCEWAEPDATDAARSEDECAYWGTSAQTTSDERCLSVREAVKKYASATCTPTRTGSRRPDGALADKLDVDELTGLRKVSQLLCASRGERDFNVTYSPASYCNEYRPAQRKRAQQDDSVNSVSADQTCAGCGKQLQQGAAMYIAKLRSVFHLHCFRCSECRDPLVNKPDDDVSLQNVSVLIRAEKLLCANCFARPS